MSDAARDVWMWGGGGERNGEAPEVPVPLVPDVPSVRWLDEGEALEAGDYVPIIKADRIGTPLKVVAINDQFQGVWVHWLDGQDVPCAGYGCGCPHCPSGGPPKLVGYVLAYRLDLFPAILQVPAGVLSSRPGIWRRGANLRGRLLTAKRHPRGRNGYVSLEVSDKPARLAAGAELPPDRDLRALLLHVWGRA